MLPDYYNNSVRELRAWQVIDDKGERTTVRLESMTYGVPLANTLFERPNF